MSCSTSTSTEGGGVARATYILSARGNYTVLFDYPATN